MFEAQLVLMDVAGVEVSGIKTHVFNEKSQRVFSAGLECCCRSRCHHNPTESEEWAAHLAPFLTTLNCPWFRQ